MEEIFSTLLTADLKRPRGDADDDECGREDDAECAREADDGCGARPLLLAMEAAIMSERDMVEGGGGGG